MNDIQALLLGIVQGLTEYLPVSSSGHLAIVSHFFGVNGEENLTFTIAVHVATVLSTLVVLWKEIVWLVKGVFDMKAPLWSRERRYALAILISMIPVGIVGLFFKDQVEAIFGSGLRVVGICLLITAANKSLGIVHLKVRQEAILEADHHFRQGAFLQRRLMLGNNKSQLAQFSFLMVIPPIMGEALLDTLKAIKGGAEAAVGDISLSALAIGFAAAFICGCFACKWMINIVRRGKLIYFGIYCAIVGLIILFI